MERGRAPAGADRGGAVISPLRHARLIAGAAAFATLAGADAFGVFARGKYAPAELVCAGLSIGLLALALVLRRTWPALWAIVFGGAGYATSRAGHTSIDTRAVIVGVLLLLTAELATWSMDSRLAIEWQVHARRGAIVTVVAACAAGVDAFVLAAAGVSVAPSAALAAVGVAAAAGAVALVVMARR